MRLLDLTICNIKRYLKNPNVFLLIFMLPIVIVCGVSFLNKAEKINIAVFNKDNGEYSKQLIELLSEEFKVIEYHNDIQDYNEILDKNNISGIYEINESFSEDILNKRYPIVNLYTLEDDLDTVEVSDYIIEKFINEKINATIDEIKIIENNNKEYEEYVFLVILISYLMILSSTAFSEDIIKIKNQNVLKRILATGNSDRLILCSMYLAAFILQTITTLLALAIIVSFNNIVVYNVLNTIIVIILSSLLSTALVVVTTRWVKNRSIASIINIVYALLAMLLSAEKIEGTYLENLPECISKFSMFSPITWFVDIIHGENILISIIIVVIMSIMFFTVGSFKLREYVED